MQKNRRRYLRKIPEESAFIQIERDEVGTVRNISEGGLSFRSFAPVPEFGPVYFWLSFNLKDQIEAMGEVTWTDASRKTGGLRFTALSESGRAQIRRWLWQLPLEPAAEQEPVLQVVAKEEPTRTRKGQLDRVAKFVAKASSRSPILSLSLQNKEPAAVSDPSPSPAPGIESPAELVPLQRYLSVKKRQLVRGMLLGMCLSAAVGISAFEYWRYHSRAANNGTVPAQTTAPKANVVVPPPPPPVVPASNATVGAIFSESSQNKRAASDQVVSRHASDSYSLTPSRAADSKVAKPSALTADASPNAGKANANKKPLTRAQLWAAIQAGNMTAAVELAEHYIKGDGVPQNCQQARVLLLMASEKRNEAAIKRLHELDQDPTTCP
jgi:hypothetical protein